MTRRLYISAIALAALTVAACSPQAPTPQVADAPVAEAADEGGHAGSLVPKMSCEPDAMFSAATTKASLIADHGADVVREEKVPWADSEMDAIIMWPDDPSMRAEVLWFGDKSGMPEGARVSGGPESLWVGPEGLLLGSSIADIERANGGPFMMTAFENHNHGEVSNFLGGRLAGAEGAGCRVSFALDAGPGATEAAVAALSGDSEKSFRSDSAEVLAAQPVIAEMSILFAKP
ncbi:MAG: hypothetical protein RIR33_301 [Pseudomonadota bacterium]|jgi:hypothetical protein